MKNNNARAKTKTNLILQKANVLMNAYSRVTGAFTCIYDHNYLPTQEFSQAMLTEKNICIFCIKYRKHFQVNNLRDLAANPCREMHMKAISESHRFGGSYTYMCNLGFMFWTSPFFLNGRFIGALMGSGFTGADAGEICTRMSEICEGTLSETELKRLLSRFPGGDAGKIKALAELLLICSQSISVGSEGCHASMKRRSQQQTNLAAKIAVIKNQHPDGTPRPAYPLDKEQKLLEALRRGDADSGKKILNEILAFLVFKNQDKFKLIHYRAIELAVLVSRIDKNFGFSIKNILEATDIENLTDAMHYMIDHVAGQSNSFQGFQHASALKKAKKYIMENFTRKLSLEEIAGASGFSAPYFSTIFKEEMGENVSSYLNRLRVEKASLMLTSTNISLSNISQACSFEDQSWFSKIFKHYTGMSPGKYRNQKGKLISKIPEPGFSEEYIRKLEEN